MKMPQDTRTDADLFRLTGAVTPKLVARSVLKSTIFNGATGEKQLEHVSSLVISALAAACVARDDKKIYIALAHSTLIISLEEE